MPALEETAKRLAAIPNLQVQTRVPLAPHTRFGIGGPADLFAEAGNAGAIVQALRAARSAGLPSLVIGGGTNLVVSDNGFRGLVVRYTAGAISADGPVVTSEAGAELDTLVDFAVGHGLKGFETLARIPGSVGAAVYGNAGAYGHSISERLRAVRFLDGEVIRSFGHAQCEFQYRDSVFKRHRDWTILSAEWLLERVDPETVRRVAREIRSVRDEKFPATMKCAGSVFKNLQFTELPAAVAAQVRPDVIREGKVPAAYFLEQVGAKGLALGDIRVADYHANLIYNEGRGTARDLRELISQLKALVRARFGLELEEEVQYIG